MNLSHGRGSEQSMRLSCDRCHRSKTKCIPSRYFREPLTCQRCARAQTACSFSPRSKMGRPVGRSAERLPRDKERALISNDQSSMQQSAGESIGDPQHQTELPDGANDKASNGELFKSPENLLDFSHGWHTPETLQAGESLDPFRYEFPRRQDCTLSSWSGDTTSWYAQHQLSYTSGESLSEASVLDLHSDLVSSTGWIPPTDEEAGASIAPVSSSSGILQAGRAINLEFVSQSAPTTHNRDLSNLLLDLQHQMEIIKDLPWLPGENVEDPIGDSGSNWGISALQLLERFPDLLNDIQAGQLGLAYAEKPWRNVDGNEGISSQIELSEDVFSLETMSHGGQAAYIVSDTMTALLAVSCYVVAMRMYARLFGVLYKRLQLSPQISYRSAPVIRTPQNLQIFNPPLLAESVVKIYHFFNLLRITLAATEDLMDPPTEYRCTEMYDRRQLLTKKSLVPQNLVVNVMKQEASLWSDDGGPSMMEVSFRMDKIKNLLRNRMAL